MNGTRVATLAAVLLIHLGMLVFLLAPPVWQAAPPLANTVVADVLQLRLLTAPPVTQVALPPRAMPHAATVQRVPSPPRPSQATDRPAPSPPSIDGRLVAPPAYVAGGGLLGGTGYGRQNVRLPGRDEPLRGMPRFRMADPRQQGLAGVVRFIGHLSGAVDPHCLDLERARGMTPRERIERHVDGDEAGMAATAARYRCPDPLKPGAAMYYFGH